MGMHLSVSAFWCSGPAVIPILCVKTGAFTR